MFPGTLNAAPNGEPTTFEELQGIYEPNNPPSDFVVVIDTSSSMLDPASDPRYPRVQAAFAKLVDALPAGTNLTTLTFDSIVQKEFGGPLRAEDRGRAKQLPAADGNATDIGAALGAAVDALDRPDAPPVQTVIFITDGIPNPPPSSSFAAVDNQAWTGARSRATDLGSKRRIRVYPFGLGSEGKKGAEYVQRVFANVEPVLNVPSEQLAAELTKAAEQARRESLRAAAEEEIKAHPLTVDIKPSGSLDSAVKASIEVTSSMPNLGVDLELENISATDQNGAKLRIELRDEDRVRHIPPGASTTFSVIIKPEVVGVSQFRMPPPKREEVDVILNLGTAANATPTEVLRLRLGVDPAVATESAQPFTLARTVGKTWGRFSIELLMLFALLCLAWWLTRNVLIRPPLYGALMPVGILGRSVSLRGRSRMVQTSDFGWPKADPTVKFFTKRMKRGKVFVKTIGSGRLQRQDGITQTWDIVPDSTRVGIGQYRFGTDSTTGWTWSVDPDEIAKTKGERQ